MISLRPIICFILSLTALSCALSRPALPERVVKVKLVVDRRAREANVGWRDDILRKFTTAADFFEDEFGIRFAVAGMQPWNYQEAMTSTADLLKLLKKQVPVTDAAGRFDLVIGFTQLPGRVMPGHARVDEIGDCNSGLGNYIVLSITDTDRYLETDRARGDRDSQSLIHELGHIFGAEHVDDRDSVMAVQFRPYTDFDKKNREVVFKNKFCAFRNG